MRAEIIILFALVSSFQLSVTCSPSTYYYDTSVMECKSCPTNQQASPNYLSCICQAGMAKTTDTRNHTSFSCSLCPTGQVPSSDQYECQYCPNNSISNNECSCSANQIIEEYNQTTDYLSTKECIACNSSTYPGSNSYACVECPDINMIRDPTTFACICISNSYYSSDNTCIPQSDQIASGIEENHPVERSMKVIYSNLVTSQGIISTTIASDTFGYFYMKAAYDCYKYSDTTSCQLLGNLCVLQLYNISADVCQLYQQLQPNRLYYTNNTETFLNSERVSMEITFDPNDNTKVYLLQFMLAQFYLNGTFIGYQNLTDQLVLCPHSYVIGQLYREFGTNVDVVCNLDLSVYISTKETIFYELYLIDSDNSLIDVPILIKNLVASDGSQPNNGANENAWILTRRFFIYDNVSGKEGTNAYIDGKTTSYLQYMREATLRVTLINDQDQKIYDPILILNYQTRMTTYIEGVSSTDTVSFTSEYTMNTSRF